MALAAFLDSLPPPARRAFVAVWGLCFIGLLFVLVPSWAAEANQELGWPRWRSGLGRVLGAALLLSGLFVALYCSRLFARIGRGTPVPIDPPRELVVEGLYRHSRNPIYVAQVAILLSYFCWSGELALLLYAAVYALGIQLFLVWIEEPGLRNRFGEAYASYTREVPRWIGRSGAR